MRITKKITSIVLAVLMVVSMMSVMAVTASAAVGDYVAEEDYLTFTAVEAGASVTLKVASGSNLQYSLNGGELIPYTAGSLISLAKGDSVRFRGKNTTFNSSNHVSIGGKVACSGNVMSLRLDDDGMSQGLSNSCFSNMFSDCTGLTAAPKLPETILAARCYESMFEACTNLTVAPELPATMLEIGCYSSMFVGCTSLTTAPKLPATALASSCYERMFYICMSLTTAPELPATTLAPYCYNSMFARCTSLTTAPELPATTLEYGCYSRMFYGCSKIKLSETQTAEYSIPYSVPSGGNGTTASSALSSALNNMFAGTGGTFKGTPEINKTYYVYREVPKYTVTWKNGETTLETDTDVAEGSTPSYGGETPEKASDTYYDYTFSGWSDDSNTYAADALPAVSGDVTYTAQFTATAKTFKVYVKKLTGGTYNIENLTGGTTVAQLKEIIADQIDIPVTAQQRLIFAGKQIEDAKTLAEYNIEKESTIHLIIRGYTVTWLNYDNSELGTANVAYGTTPSYGGATPTKASDSDKHYTFSGWYDGTNTYGLSDTLPNVTADVTYTAQFTEDNHAYTLNPTFNWSQDASTGDWNCNKLTLTCSGCDETQDYEVTGFFGASAVTVTANNDGSFTYSVSKKVDGTTYSDTKTTNANGVIKSTTQLKAAAKKGGEWELGEDLTGVTDVQCANGFVLDGNNHTVTRHANVSTQAVFRTTTNPAEVTLKNLTIDGIAGQSDSKPAIATKMSNPSAGNVINLENVTITNYDFDASNNGVVLAWGQATVNMKNCTVDTDSDYDVWGGAASTINVDGGKVGTAYLNGGTASAALTNGAVVDNFATSSDNNIKDNGDGTYSVVPKVYVAQVGSTKYESLADAINAAQDGGTVKLLADQTVDLQVAAGEEYTIDLNSYTMTVTSSQSYNYIYGDLTIEDNSSAKTGKVIVSSYGISPIGDDGKVTVNSGSFTTAAGKDYIFYLMGGELEVNGGTFTANHPVNCYSSGKKAYGGKVVINDGEFTSTEYYVISGFENSDITINGGEFEGPYPIYVDKTSSLSSGFTPASATINGGTFTATSNDGYGNTIVDCENGASVTIKGGTFTGGDLYADDSSDISVSGGTFDSAVPEEYCANGYAPKDNGDDTYGVGPDTSSPLNPIEKAAADINDGNAFGLECDYLKGTLLGVQKKSVAGEDTSSQEGAKNMRFVAVLDTDLVQDADDYGFVLAKVGSTRTYNDTNIEGLKANWGNGEKTISAKGTSNNVSGNEAYGDPSNTTTDYKYITCAVNNVTDDDKVIARFYYKKDGKTYYAKYAGHNYQYTGCMAAWSDLA